MDAHARRRDLRAVVPRLMTAGRFVLGAAALVFALDGVNLFLAATLTTLAVVLDGLSAPLARWLNSNSPFTTIFDAFADYQTLIVAPWVLTQSLLIGRRSFLQEVLLDLPLVTGAVRCARKGALVVREDSDGRELPGLDAVFFAFVSVTAVFLRLQAVVSTSRLTAFLSPAIAVLSVMMVVPVRYPKLTAVPALLPAVLVFVAAMPFVGTEILASAAIVLGLLYIFIAPFLAGDSSAKPDVSNPRSPSE